MANRTRNVSPSIIPWGSEGSTYDPIAVSYTHLDVYKRQYYDSLEIELSQKYHTEFGETFEIIRPTLLGTYLTLSLIHI